MFTLLTEEQKQIFELKPVPEGIQVGDYAVFVSSEQNICETPYQDQRVRWSSNTLYQLYRIKKITRNSVHIYNDLPYKGTYYSRYRINPDYEELNREYPPSNETYYDTIKYIVPQRVIAELYPRLPFNNKYYFRIRETTTCLSYDIQSSSYEEGCLKKVEIYNNSEFITKGWCDACWSKRQNLDTLNR